MMPPLFLPPPAGACSPAGVAGGFFTTGVGGGASTLATTGFSLTVGAAVATAVGAAVATAVGAAVATAVGAAVAVTAGAVAVGGSGAAVAAAVATGRHRRCRRDRCRRRRCLAGLHLLGAAAEELERQEDHRDRRDAAADLEQQALRRAADRDRDVVVSVALGGSDGGALDW